MRQENADRPVPICTIYAGSQVDRKDVLDLIDAISRVFESIGGEPLIVCETSMTIEEARAELQSASPLQGDNHVRP